MTKVERCPTCGGHLVRTSAGRQICANYCPSDTIGVTKDTSMEETGQPTSAKTDEDGNLIDDNP